MSTMAPERLAEVADTWRRGLDADDLANPAGPVFDGDEYAVYEITMTGPGPVTQCTINSGSFDPLEGLCYCCRQL